MGCIGKFGRRQGEKLSLKICKAGQVTARLFLYYSNAIFFRAGAPDALDGSLFSDFSSVLSKDKSQTRRKSYALPSTENSLRYPVGIHGMSRYRQWANTWDTAIRPSLWKCTATLSLIRRASRWTLWTAWQSKRNGLCGHSFLLDSKIFWYNPIFIPILENLA